MKQQPEDSINESEQLLQYMHACEKQINNCPVEKFRDLRFELKQLKEKLRHINQWNRLK